jgi:phosphoglycolate phosphatase-like HAD superfamily hydrolase
MTVLVLFDVDGTLVQTAHAGVRGMNAAFARLYGRDGALDGIPIAGRTDRAIVADAFVACGLPWADGELDRLRAAYLDELRLEIARPTTAPMGVLPGVPALLDALSARGDVHVGLLTGNFRGGAAIKLGHFGLWRDFHVGAFGDDHLDRRALVPVALDEARRAGLGDPGPDRVVVIGDTPLDVDCARAHGARALAVATGSYEMAALIEAGADLAVDSLAEGARIVEWIASATRAPRPQRV